ncbi:type II toxin-antitoxin system CcdA family antitoxin [Sulfurisphaera ohwakuensis]|uniref:type II toxin-antitoxin system CcdA family antitoxin n=1 Tax=Sulfurisphaera ohwakuensis TaxID=69656 RepID=UPI0036F199CA
MGDWVAVSTKVRREVWEKAKAYNTNIGETLGKALEEEVRRREEEEETRRLLDLASKELEKIPSEEIVEEIRKWRRER